MIPALEELAQRLDKVSALALQRDIASEQYAAEWIRKVTRERMAAEPFWNALPDNLYAAWTAPAEHETKPVIFASDAQAIPYFLGVAHECIAQLRALPPGARESKTWADIARAMVAEAEAAIGREEKAARRAEKSQGATVANARFDQARKMAVEIADERWGEWRASHVGDCASIGDVTKGVRDAIGADPGSLGLRETPSLETVKGWIKDGCQVPPEAIQPGRRKKLPPR